MHNYLAFLDEFGNASLDFTKPGTSTHFIVAALTLPKDKRDEAETQVEAVRKQFFQTGPIKSSVVGTDHKRRRQVLAALLAAPFQIFALVVDKRQLTGEGLRYKGSFYKFLHGQADSELFRLFPNLELTTGQHGSREFMEGFVNYVHHHHIPNLFNQASFGFVNDKDSVLIQAADFVAGTLARCYDETVMADDASRREFTKLLAPKLVKLKYWPERFAPATVDARFDESQYNPMLADLGLRLAGDFIQRNANSRVPVVTDQVACLNYLAFHFRHVNPTRYVSSRELIHNLAERRNNAPSLHYFQTHVIAPLRDAGVLIASSSKGYKLPASESDLLDFVNHSNTIIQPLLARINKCRDQVRMATGGAIDILDRPEYDKLRER
jgi:hypothetical protein